MGSPSPDHKHLRRLAVVFGRQPVFFLTTCTRERLRVLATAATAEILRDEWRGALARHGWAIGPSVIMPDHVHCFASPLGDASSPLATFMGAWKEWTAKRLHRAGLCSSPLWQAEFFDHLLRSEESYAAKRDYMRLNPVRAGLCAAPEDWPFSGWTDFE